MSEILDIDLVRFEHGDHDTRKAIIEGVRSSLQTGFVYARHDLSETMLDEAYERLRRFFELSPEEKARAIVPGAHGQTGYTGLLVETAASSDHPDWKEMLNWSREVPVGHPLRRKYPTAYPTPVLPEEQQPGISAVLYEFHDRIQDLQRRFLRIVAEGLGADETFFDEMLVDGPTLTRAIRYPAMAEAPGDQHVWAADHGDINLITALPRATAPGLQVLVDGSWVDAVAPEGYVIINTGMMLERLTNGGHPDGRPSGRRRAGVHGRAVQRGAVPASAPVDDPAADAVLCDRRASAALCRHLRRRRPRPGAVRDQPGRRRPKGLNPSPLRRRRGRGAGCRPTSRDRVSSRRS